MKKARPRSATLKKRTGGDGEKGMMGRKEKAWPGWATLGGMMETGMALLEAEV
jgi:hypothetical protein